MTGYHGPFVADDDEARRLMELVYPGEVPVEPAGKGTAMGPTDGVFGVDRAADYVKEIRAMVSAHPTLTYIAPKGDGAHIATWDDDEASHKVEFSYLPDLVGFLRARFPR